jgi:hypothetical protein
MGKTMNRSERAGKILASGVLALLTCAPVLAAEAAKPAAPRYVPTMADYVGVYDAIQNYRNGVEKHDQKALQSAFWPDGAHIAVPSPGLEIRMPLDGSAPPPPPGLGMPGPNGGPPQGGMPPGGPPPGFAPPPGGRAGPPGAGGPPGPAGGEGEVWHMPFDSYFHFESATRATHYEYFLSIYPQPEKKPDAAGAGSMPNASSARTSIVGWPGHYEDILEKRNGEWRILQRKSVINQK